MTAPVRPNPVDAILGGGQSGNAVDNLLGDVPDPMAKYHAMYKSGQLEKDITAKNLKDEQATGPTASGGLATLGSLGGLLTAPQAAVRSVVRGQPYREAVADIQGSEAQLPKAERIGESIAGAAPAAAMLPWSPAVSGAVAGGATAAADPNPDLSIGKRAANTAIGTAVGGTIGKLGDLLTTGARAVLPEWMGGAKDLGKNVVDRTNAMRTADATNYGTAAAEGSAGRASPAVTAALAKPDIAPYADIIRQSRSFAGADDNTVLREAYKLMSERQGTTGARIANANDFKAGTSLENRDIGLAKQELSQATTDASGGSPAMPSFPKANAAHAEAAGNIKAVQQGADDASRAMSGKDVAGKKLDKNSLAAVLQRTKGYTPEQASAAAEGILGRLSDNVGLQYDPSITTGFGLTKGFGVIPSLGKINAVGPLLRATDAAAPPNSLLQLLRAGTVAGAGERP